MKWLLGLDLRPDSRGAIDWATWLTEHGTTPDRHEITCVHVVTDAVRGMIRDDAIDEILGVAHTLTVRELRTHVAKEVAWRTEAVAGTTAEDVLGVAAAYHRAESLLIGRQAPREGLALLRLGKVARRLLRRLPVSVTVVPPDLRCDEIGTGPIVAAVDCTPQSLNAARMARRLADSLSRPLHLALAVPQVINVELEYLPDPVATTLTARDEAHDRERLVRWAEDHEVRHDAVHTVVDDPVPGIADLAESLDAPLIVCGSRRLSLQERWFQSSVGTELARAARTAVMVVAS